MSAWDDYPEDYRTSQVQSILSAVRAGESAALIGLSGSGKSNLLGYLAHRWGKAAARPRLVLVDCNRLADLSAAGFFRLLRAALGDQSTVADELGALEALLDRQLAGSSPLGLLLDRFDVLTEYPDQSIYSNLRALRDTHKYELAYVVATRHPLDPHNELAELFFAHTLWLGPLSESDAIWNVQRYARRSGLAWDMDVARQIGRLSGGYPALLRAVCEAHAAGCLMSLADLSQHPAVQRRVFELLADQPDTATLRLCGLSDNPLLAASRLPGQIDTTGLTAKEHALWEYLQAHPGQVCEKDDLIRAVWPEDRIFERGIRDDSLAQLVRRLREKVEPDPSNPRRIQTVAGRGYRFFAKESA
jgi:energy-coupling factor transporter ATP-binding protein EcfA2